jgi:hypothetical protein
MRDGAEMVMVQAKVWKPGKRPRRLGRQRGRAGRRLIWGATTTQNANADRVDEFRAGGRALAGRERSAKPAVNDPATGPPLLRSGHTRLARPGGGRGRCAQNLVMFTSGQTARLTSAQ